MTDEVIEKVEQEESQVKEKLESTDGIKDTINDVFQSNFEFLEEKVKSSALSGDKNLFLNFFSKFLSIIASKKYGTLVKIEKIIKLSITIEIEGWPEQN